MALIGWYPLDGNTDDYTVNQNHGTPNNVSWVNGKIGQAGSFNGTTSKITVSQVDLLSEWSVSVWIKPVTSAKKFQFLFGNNVITGNIGRILIRHNGYVTYSYPVNTYKNFSLLTADIVDSWNHLVFVANNTGIDLYLNGVYNSRVSQIDPILNFAMIGNAWSDDYWATEGQINDVRIYNHALSQKEINDLAKAKILHYTFNKDEDIVYDSSGYKRNGNKIGLTYSNNSKLGTGTYFSPNSTSGIISKTFTTPLHITQSFWVYPTQPLSAGTGTYQNFLNETNDSLNFFYNKDYNYLYWKLIWSDNSSSYRLQVSGNSIIPNQWNHIVGTFDGKTNKLYLNGVLVNSNNPPLTEIKQYNTEIHVFKESTSFTSGFENGYIDDVQIYATALSPSDVLDLYQTRVKIDNHGNLYANEIVEDYEVKPGLTLRELFEDNNRLRNSQFELDSSSNGLANNWSAENTSQFEIVGNNNKKQKLFSGTVYSAFRLTQIMQGIPVQGHKYFLIFDFIEDENLSSKQFQVSSTSPSYVSYFTQNIQYGINQYLIEFPSFSNNNFRIQFNFSSSSNFLNGLASATMDYAYFIDVTSAFGLGNEPTVSELRSYFMDYLQSRPKSSGIVKTREFIEDYVNNSEAFTGTTVSELFFNKNWFDGTFNTNELSINYQQDGTTHTLERTSASYVMFGDSITADQYIENGDIIYARYDSFKETANDALWRIWVRRNASNEDGISLYFHTGSNTIEANKEYRNESVYGQYNGTSVLTRCHFVGGSGTIGAILTLKNPFLINLTKVFGVGNEPSQLQMDTWYNTDSNYTQQKTKIFKDSIKVFGSIKEG